MTGVDGDAILMVPRKEVVKVMLLREMMMFFQHHGDVSDTQHCVLLRCVK